MKRQFPRPSPRLIGGIELLLECVIVYAGLLSISITLAMLATATYFVAKLLRGRSDKELK